MVGDDDIGNVWYGCDLGDVLVLCGLRHRIVTTVVGILSQIYDKNLISIPIAVLISPTPLVNPVMS